MKTWTGTGERKERSAAITWNWNGTAPMEGEGLQSERINNGLVIKVWIQALTRVRWDEREMIHARCKVLQSASVFGVGLGQFPDPDIFPRDIGALKTSGFGCNSRVNADMSDGGLSD